jgi:peptidoglycan/xylan/chitin deacetylase (PgdA/CDA1 family)
LHGWNHIDYTNLTSKEQRKTLSDANGKLDTIFGTKSNVFIPPENKFNNETLKAMVQLGISVLSSEIWSENNYNGGKSIFSANNTTKIQDNKTLTQKQIYHIPETISFKSYEGGKSIKNLLNNIIGNVTNNIYKYGYAVITLHPQDFVKLENGTPVNVVDENEIKDLSGLIDRLLSQNISITSFSKLIGLSTKGISTKDCVTGFTVTGYYTLIESNILINSFATINAEGLGKREFSKNLGKA